MSDTTSGLLPGESRDDIDPQARLKRMKMRSWRRGIKEMDMVFGPYADARLDQLDAAALELYDRLLCENDQVLLTWVLGTEQAPDWTAPLLGEIAAFASARLRR
ncbi:succinate dehydrogenase assembly factor 2 [Pseudogemmobacter faecipullorum]|uniref:FAD assembly factor SdhE n=1 Tax=Pseudogemmobacter faecipullorum TaxID=2755041 RepID=A0ABS8CMN4_9RHOB|nr:succinate dehydrogenase assembly factor 2 [Pseudogemmobacter faecipullorum]MCB5410644.1 succinate dehydrogenase assembly factor 2 [Pseudogemmobacter faecipullorum]